MHYERLSNKKTRKHSPRCPLQKICKYFHYSGYVVVVDSLGIHAPIVCGGSVFNSCFVMQYLVSFLVLKPS